MKMIKATKLKLLVILLIKEKNMAKEIKNQSTKVEDYLVDRIRKLEKENEELRNLCFKFETKAQKYDELKTMFHYEQGLATSLKAIFVRDLKDIYVGCLVTENDSNFQHYLELLDLGE